jgi:GntR family transcriptional regulator
VDVAEQALRDWLVPGRHRPGDRLPPEHDLAAMLGVSRGTLRVALERLERTGEIVRRQGSGTFVGRVAELPAFSEGLEVLESYTSLAARQGLKLSTRDLVIEERPVEADPAAALGLEPGTPVVAIERILLADGAPAAHMCDLVHPDIVLPSRDRIVRAVEKGTMVLDVLIAAKVPIAFARTTVRPRLLTARAATGRALEVSGTTAALELIETMHVTSGEAMQYATDVFAPGSVDLHVMRGLQGEQPEQVSTR